MVPWARGRRAGSSVNGAARADLDAHGRIDPARLAKLQDFYLAKGIIAKKTPVDELYTNQFVM